MRTLASALLALPLLLVAAAAPAGQLEVGNLDRPDTVEFNVSFSSAPQHYVQAQAFTTGPGEYQLNQVVISAFSNSSGTADLQLRSDAAGAPGQLIEDLGSQGLSNGSNPLLTYGSKGSLLQGNTTYWVTVGEMALTGRPGSSGDFSWNGTDPGGASTPGPWTIANEELYSANQGITWQPNAYGPPTYSALLGIYASPVPEPSCLILACIGGACLAWKGRSRRWSTLKTR